MLSCIQAFQCDARNRSLARKHAPILSHALDLPRTQIFFSLLESDFISFCHDAPFISSLCMVAPQMHISVFTNLLHQGSPTSGSRARFDHSYHLIQPQCLQKSEYLFRIIIYAYVHRLASSAIPLLLSMKDLLPSNLKGYV